MPHYALFFSLFNFSRLASRSASRLHLALLFKEAFASAVPLFAGAVQHGLTSGFLSTNILAVIAFEGVALTNLRQCIFRFFTRHAGSQLLAWHCMAEPGVAVGGVGAPAIGVTAVAGDAHLHARRSALAVMGAHRVNSRHLQREGCWAANRALQARKLFFFLASGLSQRRLALRSVKASQAP